MNCLRFSGSGSTDTCSAETVVPRITKMSTPESTTALAKAWVFCGESAPADGYPGRPDFLQPFPDQLGLDRLGVDLLQPPRAHTGSDRCDLLQQLLRLFVARPQSLKVQHAEPAELAEFDRGGGHITESIGAATSGKWNVSASIRQVSDTSSSSRVRRVGTMATSSKANACCGRACAARSRNRLSCEPSNL